MPSRTCVFCKLICGEHPPHTVYENERVLAIMDLRQANAGHVLVIPKQHVPTIYDLPTDIGAEIMTCVIEISRALKEAFQAEGLSIWQSNGPCAGQEADHVHFHVHPRKPDDGLLRVYPSEPAHPSGEELQQYVRKIQAFLPQ